MRIKGKKTRKRLPAPRLRFHGDVNKHDHTEGTANCRACQAENSEDREGGIEWRVWCAGLVEKLTGRHVGPDVDARFIETGLDRKDAVDMWGRNFTVDAFMRLRKLTLGCKRRPRTSTVESAIANTPRVVWDGWAPCGKHGADFEGQQCSICPRTIVRLFDDTTEVCTSLGQQVSMHVNRVAKEALDFLQREEPNASLRDFEMLFVQSVQMQVARAIVMRRRPR